MPITTRFTELVGVQHPIMMGGLHYVGYARLAAAVSNAGGLGCITALTQPNPEALRAEIRATKKLTTKPFGVNLTLLPALAPPDYPAYAQVVVDEGVKVVETAGHNPEKFIKFFKDAGAVVIHKCVAIKHALTAQRLGADVVSLDGFEAGGHPGELGTTNWVLFAKALKTAALSIPYIASGSCCDGAQLAAALALGCQGINMGTRFLATRDSGLQPGIHKAMLGAGIADTTTIFTTLANTERVFKNATAEKVRQIEREDPGNFEPIAPYVKGLKYKESFWETGNSEDSVWSCGQGVGLVDDIPTCAELVSRIVREAEDAINVRVLPLLSRSRL